MALHEFGLLPESPVSGVRYDGDTPEAYHCIDVDDELVERLDSVWNGELYWHTMDWPAKGLNYCGITLIPPQAIDSLLAAGEGWRALRLCGGSCCGHRIKENL